MNIYMVSLLHRATINKKQILPKCWAVWKLAVPVLQHSALSVCGVSWQDMGPSQLQCTTCIDWYQVILLDDRCAQSHDAAVLQMGVKPVTRWSQVRCPTHCATALPKTQETLVYRKYYISPTDNGESERAVFLWMWHLGLSGLSWNITQKMNLMLYLLICYGHRCKRAHPQEPGNRWRKAETSGWLSWVRFVLWVSFIALIWSTGRTSDPHKPLPVGTYTKRFCSKTGGGRKLNDPGSSEKQPTRHRASTSTRSHFAFGAMLS